MKPIEFVRIEDTCPECFSKTSVHLYDANNNDIGYTYLLDNDNPIPPNSSVREARCSKCGKTFKLLWSSGNHYTYAKPISSRDKSLENFLQQYNKYSEE